MNGPGVHTVPADVYHTDPCEQPSLSASIACILCTSSPAHARAAHPRLNPDFRRHEEERFDVGTAAHALLLEGSSAIEVVDADDWRTKDAKAVRDAARAAGRLPLLAKHWASVQAMVAATRAQLALVDADPPLFTEGKPEQSLVWDDGGVTCRARLDWLRDDFQAIDDYKTTSRSANPDSWSRTLFGIGADVQTAFYLRGLRAVTGVDAVMRYVVQETYPPYALSVVSLAPSALELGRDKVDHAVSVWRQCVASDVWPAYPPRVAFAEAPSWEQVRWVERYDEAVA